jgi:hypothetical protein
MLSFFLYDQICADRAVSHDANDPCPFSNYSAFHANVNPMPPHPPAAELGDLDRVKRVIKLVGFVNCIDGFENQPQVINGCSNFLGLILGEAGVHARSAVGTNALPLNVAVECEAIVEVHE